MFIELYEVKKPYESFCLTPSIFWENCIKLTFSGCPRKFYHRVMYIAPSSGHISLNFNMPFKLILRRFEVVFWCLDWECCTFWKIDGNLFKSTNYTTVNGVNFSRLAAQKHIRGLLNSRLADAHLSFLYCTKLTSYNEFTSNWAAQKQSRPHFNTHGQYTTPTYPKCAYKISQIFSWVSVFARAEFCSKFTKINVPRILLYAPYILRVKFFANRDFKTFSWVVKFAIEEESNGHRNQYLSFTHFQKAKLAILPCTCTVYCTTSIAYTSRIHAAGSEINIFVCC